ncbi:MAG TPA: PucR family transcriptional regulator [Pseudonocardiaceae bacterium]|jgi:purine catabolism regulator|nr:PucR family transcriptional regulator [Pseudonocardiaceae bacterium]
MPLTLADLLVEPGLRLRLHTGADLVDRRIGWAHATELVDPTAFLEGGELLLTTGLALRSDYLAYVGRLAGIGVAALGFGTGLSHRTVPEQLVTAAAAHGLPLVEVPRATPFIAITKAVSTALAAESYASVVRTNAGQEELARASISGGVGALVRRLARLLGGWVLLTDGGGGVLAAAPASAADRLAGLRADIDRLRGRRGVSTFGRSLGDQEVVLQVLGSGRRGVLVVGRESTVDQADQHIVNTAAALLTVALEQGSAQRDALRRLRTGLFGLLLAGRTELVAECLSELGSSLPTEPVLLAVLSGPRSGVRAGYQLADAELGAEFFAELTDRLVILLPADHPRPDEVLTGLAGRAELHAGLSAPGGLAGLATALRQAGQAADAARRGGVPLARFADLAGHGLFDLLPESATAAAESLLAPLRQAGRGDLVESLRCWLSVHGQWDPAAGLLGVHRHTLRNRMTRVEQLTGRDLDSPGVRAEFWVALGLVDQSATG